MSNPIVAPFGTWPSTITARLVAAAVRPVASPRLVGDRVLWLETVPEELGRSVVVTTTDGGAHRVVTPPSFNVRTRVHEYGGGAWATAGDTIWFSNFADNLVYEQRGDAAPVALTSESAKRHADFELDFARQRLIAVREEHGTDSEPRNTVVALGLVGEAETTLISGSDFYAAPRLSPDGRRLAWLSWNHPSMPWEDTELWVSTIADDGTLTEVHRVAARSDEALCQPVWGPDGHLYVVSDRSGFWNLYRLEDDDLVAVCPMAAEFGLPMWSFAQSSYGFTGPHEIVAVCRENARSRLLRIDVRSGAWSRIDVGYEDIFELRAGPGFVVLDAGSPTLPQRIVRLSLADGAETLLASSIDDIPVATLLSAPRAISFTSNGGRIVHAFHYPPHNDDYIAPAGELPPLIVFTHGGPTSMTVNTLKLATQFWTSRGFAVLDVNYSGSTGFGRAYRQRLSGQWGIVDVEDCIAGARYLVEQNLVDGDRLAIRGSSAGGYATLAAIAFHDVFKAGTSYFGVGDLRALDADVHKFESHYTTDLLGPMPERAALYAERSPLHHAHRISRPILFLQGLDDRVVLPSQSETMVRAMRKCGVPAAYLAFEGEGHGFRRRETLQRALEAELSFYAQLFGFEPADEIERLVLE